MPELVRQPPVPCWPWELRVAYESDGHPIGAECDRCGCEIALPRQFAGRSGRCLYCSLGTIFEPIERPPDDQRRLWELPRIDQ